MQTASENLKSIYNAFLCILLISRTKNDVIQIIHFYIVVAAGTTKKYNKVFSIFEFPSLSHEKYLLYYTMKTISFLFVDLFRNQGRKKRFKYNNDNNNSLGL